MASSAAGAGASQQPPAPPAVLFEVRGKVAIVTLNRPSQLNAVSPEVGVRLAAAWREIRE